MRDAVIVSTARTGLAKSWRGAFNMTHGATMGAPRRAHAIERARLDPAEVDDVLIGCAFPEGATGVEHRAPDRAARRLPGRPVPGMTVNRFCSSGLQTIALAAQRIIAGEGDVFVAGGVESISCVQNEANQHMLREPWLARAQAGDLLADAADRRDTSRSATASRASGRTSTACAASSAPPPPRRPGSFADEIVPMTTTMGVADKEIGPALHARGHARRRRRHSRRTRRTKASRRSSRRCRAA